MLFTSSIFTKLSGKMGGTVAAHNRGGQYLRQLVTPVNPNTPLQAAVRNIFANLAVAWQGLTDLQRAAWDDYGANVPVINRVGAAINLTGFNHYIRSNVPREQVGLSRVDDGPTNFSLPATGLVGATITAGAGLAIAGVTFDVGEDWVGEDGAGLLIGLSRQQAPTINFFKGPFNSQAPVLGDSVTPPSPPVAIITTIPATAGNLMYGSFRVTRADGRLSTMNIQVADIT